MRREITRGGRIMYHSHLDRHAVYFIYDRFDRVIYIGSSHDPEARYGTHRCGPFTSEIADWAYTWFPDQASAIRAEYGAIAALEPDHNWAGTPYSSIVNRAPTCDRESVADEYRNSRRQRAERERAALQALFATMTTRQRATRRRQRPAPATIRFALMPPEQQEARRAKRRKPPAE